jgi:hypothetical protein
VSDTGPAQVFELRKFRRRSRKETVKFSGDEAVGF